MKYLVIQTGKLGDMVCTTPIFRAIKEKYPDIELHVAGAALNAEVLRGSPHVARYWDFRALTAATVRQERFDVAVLLTPSAPVLKMLVLARVQKIIAPKIMGGYSPYMSLSYQFWLFFATAVPHRMGHYAPQEYLNALALLGITTDDTRKELFVTEEAQTSVDTRLAPYKQQLKVAIAPGAGNKIKEWPPERFNEVAKYLVGKKYALVVLIGAKADTELANIVAKNLPQGSVLNTVGKLSIEELKGLVKRVDLFVSADTGPIYIAEAFDVPTVDIVGPMDEQEQPPRGPKHLVVVPQRMEAMLHIMNARVYDEAEARRQVAAVSVEAVLRNIEKLIAV